jgi:hypothetical protein
LKGRDVGFDPHLTELLDLTQTLADVADVLPQVPAALAHPPLQLLQPCDQLGDLPLALHIHQQPDLVLAVAHLLFLLPPQPLPLLHVVEQLGEVELTDLFDHAFH